MQASQAKEIRENLTVITTERFSLFSFTLQKAA
jgi:type IV secretory pathway VirB9-like protein